MVKCRLVSFKGSPWVQRVAIVQRQKRIDFEFIQIEADNRPAWFRAISPHNKVPVLGHADQAGRAMRYHGSPAAGPRTVAGKARLAAAQHLRWARWRAERSTAKDR